jgi:hypothetical protein
MKNRYLKIASLLVVPLTFVANYGHAQEKAAPSIGLQIGTLGIGAQYIHPLTSKWELRSTLSYLQLTKKRELISTSLTTDETIKMRTGGIGIYANYNVFSKTPNWKVSLGAVYQFNRIIDTRVYEVEYNNSQIDLGSLSLEFTTFPVSPYAGILWGNFKSEKKININLELGTLYHGKPNVVFTGEGRIAPTAEQGPLVEENVKDYNWYPYLSFNINYKLKY